MSTSDILQHLYSLDVSSPGVSRLIYRLIRRDKEEQYLSSLQESESARLVDLLDKALDVIPTTDVVFPQCLHKLRAICGHRRILPSSYTVSGDLIRVSDGPIAWGGSADVWKGTQNGREVCIKELRIPVRDDRALLKSFFKEVVIWKSLRHPNIVPFIGVTMNPSQIVSEWMPNGTLTRYVEKRPSANRIGLLLDVAEGLSYLHGNHTIHGDLKGPNILVDGNGHARLTDFGLSSITRGTKSVLVTQPQGWTEGWTAPEILMGTSDRITWEADTFAFGMVMIEAFTGRHPFGSFKSGSPSVRIINGERPNRPQGGEQLGLVDPVWDLTVSCWQQDPSRRPKVVKVVRILHEHYMLSTEDSHLDAVAPGQPVENLAPTQSLESSQNSSQLSFQPHSIPTDLQSLPDETHTLPSAGNPSSRGKSLRTGYKESVAATIERSLASPTFRGLGPDARELLGIIAFFPQGVDEKNLDWLFPTISNRRDIFDKLCVLSLTYRSNGFTTMLAPLRDYLRPKDPASSLLLRTTKECYFRRLSVFISPDKPGLEETQWITSEDVNVEHLFDVFTSVDVDSDDVWVGCANFIAHLCWHKPRLVGLGPKIEGLSDGHSSKPECLFELSRLFFSVGNSTKPKRLLTHALKIWRERGNTGRVAATLRFLAAANERLGLYKEGIQRMKEASELYAQLGDVGEQARGLEQLVWLLRGDGLLDAAETAASQLIAMIIPEGPRPYHLCRSHHLLGGIYHSKGETEKAIDHFKIALDIASPFNWNSLTSRNHYYLAEIYSGQGQFDDAHAHIEQAKLHSINDPYSLGWATSLQAISWHREGRYEEAKAECLRAIELFGSLKAMKDVETCRKLLRRIEKSMGPSVVITPGGSNLDERGVQRWYQRILGVRRR